MPNNQKKIKAKISSYKSALNTEKKLHGVISDGAGKRYILFSLYFLLNDLKKSEEYFKWYEKEFKDDPGEPVQKLCWAVTLHRMGKLDPAGYRLADLMLSNLYVIPKVLGRDIKKYEIWHSSSDESIDYFDYFPSDVLENLTREDKNWIEEVYDSFVFQRIRQRYIEIFKELQTVEDIQSRRKMIVEADSLLDQLSQPKNKKQIPPQGTFLSDASQRDRGRDIRIKTINRTAITIVPKQPYIDWANSLEDAETYDTPHVTTILIPDKYDEFDYETYVKKIFNQIFEEQLESWMAYPEDWPQKRTYKMFKKWFNIICSDMTWDYGDGYIEHDEY